MNWYFFLLLSRLTLSLVFDRLMHLNVSRYIQMWLLFHSSWSSLGFSDMLIHVFHKIWDIFSNILPLLSPSGTTICVCWYTSQISEALFSFLSFLKENLAVVFFCFFLLPSPPFFLSTYLPACLIFFLYSFLLSSFLSPLRVGKLSWPTFKFTDYFFVNWNLLLYPSNEFCILVSLLFNSRISVWFFLKTCVYLYFLFSEMFFWCFPLFLYTWFLLVLWTYLKWLI